MPFLMDLVGFGLPGTISPSIKVYPERSAFRGDRHLKCTDGV